MILFNRRQYNSAVFWPVRINASRVNNLHTLTCQNELAGMRITGNHDVVSSGTPGLNTDDY